MTDFKDPIIKAKLIKIEFAIPQGYIIIYNYPYFTSIIKKKRMLIGFHNCFAVATIY